MGILFTKKVEGPAELGVWHITEETGPLLEQVRLSQEEQELYACFRTERRQKQWLAYRRMIRELISPQRYPVHYDGSGKPFLAGSSWHISVTHTEDYAGVILSRDVRVGIDMERIRPRIVKVKEKFLSEEELVCIDDDRHLEQLTLMWCAKEAVYKLYGWKNLDFRANIRIHLPSGIAEGTFMGEILLPGGKAHYDLFYEKHGELLLVWAIGPAEERGAGKGSST